MVSGRASESPDLLTFPASARSFIAPTVSSIGVSGSTRCWSSRSTVVGAEARERRVAGLSHVSRAYRSRHGSSPSSPRTLPDFVASTTSCCGRLSLCQFVSQLVNRPYMSTMSREGLCPRSMARWIRGYGLLLVARAVEPLIPMHPAKLINRRPLATPVFADPSSSLL